jgi:hypothetical protein
VAVSRGERLECVVVDDVENALLFVGEPARTNVLFMLLLLLLLFTIASRGELAAYEMIDDDCQQCKHHYKISQRQTHIESELNWFWSMFDWHWRRCVRQCVGSSIECQQASLFFEFFKLLIHFHI